MRLNAQTEQTRRDFELEKCRMEHKFRMRTVVNEDHSAVDAEIAQNSVNNRYSRMKVWKLPPFKVESDRDGQSSQ